MDLENISQDYGKFYELLRDEVALQKNSKMRKKEKNRRNPAGFPGFVGTVGLEPTTPAL